MIYHRELEIRNIKYPSDGVEKEVEVYCGGERIGVITQYKHLDKISVGTLFNNRNIDLDTFDEGLRFIENELNEFIYYIVNPKLL